jgi:hypothetical protein
VLDLTRHQGSSGEDYVRVVASAAGLFVLQPDLEADGVDFALRFPGRSGTTASPSIDVQVKSWSRPRRQAAVLVYDGLNERQFNRLAGPTAPSPLPVPGTEAPEPHRFLELQTDGALLRHLCFFRSLEDEAPIPAPDVRRRRTVQVPEANLLTVRTLLGLLHTDCLASSRPDDDPPRRRHRHVPRRRRAGNGGRTGGSARRSGPTTPAAGCWSWRLITDKAVATVSDRFRPELRLGPLPSPAAA